MRTHSQVVNTNQAWVLGMSDTGVQVARSLARHGITVVGVDCDPKQPGFASRLIRTKVAPCHVQTPDVFVNWLRDQGHQMSASAVLFPTSDAYTLLISRYRERLAPHFRFALPAEDIVESLLDKAKHAHVAKQIGELCPDTYELAHKCEANAIVDRLKYPVFIKARFTYSWRKRFNVKGFVAHNKQEFLAIFEYAKSNGEDVIVQQIIGGPTECNFEVNFYRSVRGNGEILALMGVRKIRQYPLRFGVGTMVETYHEPEVIRRAINFANAIDFRGIGNIEYKKDVNSGKYYLIELNPRLWQQNSQAEACGINFPLIAYKDIMGMNVSPSLEFRDGVKWLDPLADFQAFWEERRNSGLNLQSWFKSMRGVRALSLLALDDPLPALHRVDYGLTFLRVPLYLRKHTANKLEKNTTRT